VSSPSVHTTLQSTITRCSVRFALVLCAALCVPAFAPSAQAYPVHQVAPGETLSGIAAANGMQIARLAAANGVAWDHQVVVGQSLQIPPADGAYTGTAGETLGSATSSPPVQPAAAAAPAQSAPATTTGSSSGSGSSGSSSGGGGHYVSPGETLSTIAARLGTTIAALAAANGIANPNFVMAGLTLRDPGTSTTTTAAPAPSVVPASTGSTGSTGPEGAPAATGTGASTTNERLSSSQIAAIGAQNGIPGNLAAAIAWQESGNNNAAVSSVGARGVMQIMPGTWDWINRSLASPPLNPVSATDNVRAGSLLLKQLLKESGGDENAAIAGYYQGLGSVRQRGMYDDTKQYVQNVQSLRSRVGG
jgi:soluble lytic murein transglycosylase-like protein